MPAPAGVGDAAGAPREGRSAVELRREDLVREDPGERLRANGREIGQERLVAGDPEFRVLAASRNSDKRLQFLLRGSSWKPAQMCCKGKQDQTPVGKSRHEVSVIKVTGDTAFISPGVTDTGTDREGF